MELRSKTVAITPVQNPNGSISYQVMGRHARKAKQRKQHFACWDDAVATQAAWETERIQHAAALHPKITRLTQAELAHAEAATELLRGTGYTLMDAARFLIRQNPPAASPALDEPKSIAEALQAFLEERKPFVGACQYENLRLASRHFAEFAGEETALPAITSVTPSGAMADGVCMDATQGDFAQRLACLPPHSDARPAPLLLAHEA